MKTVNVHQAKTNLSGLLAEVEKKGTTYVICRDGEPVADLVPHKLARRSDTDPKLAKIKILYDPIEEASSDEWPEEAR